ncbi:MAG: periplasmic heavy metal sensor [Bacteroidales bacterium]|nr:periplasmic heavy metal sensor [Bacteroidales bacterium]
MKTKFFKTGTAIMIFLIAGMTSYSQPPKGNKMAQKPGYYQMQMQSFLKLTEDQQSKMKELRLNKTREMLPLQNKMKVLFAEYRELVSAEKPDMKAINNNIDARTKLMNEIMKKNAAYKLKFRNILTDEQWLLIVSHKGMMGPHKSKGMHRRFRQQGPCGLMQGRGPRNMRGFQK